MSIGQRIKEIIYREKISNKEFANRIGVHQNSVSKMFRAAKPPKAETLIEIRKNFPQYSLDWILLGDDDMYQSIEMPILAEVATGKLSALVDLVSGGGTLRVPILQKGYKALRVKGNSMEPTLYEGDIVLCEKVSNTIDLSPRKLYIVDSDKGLVIKRIHINEYANRIQLISDNRIYTEKILELSEIKEIWEVKSIIKQ